MARINLLPWRDEYRREKQREFLGVLAAVAILALVCVYIWISSVNSAIDSQKQRNQILTKEIAVLDKRVREIRELKKRREELLSRMKVIQGLQGERPVIVRYFDEVVRAVPEGVYLTKLTRTGKSVNVSGITESNVRVSSFMRNLDASEWFSTPNLKSVKAAPKFGDQASEFVMTFNTTKPNESDDQATSAGGQAPGKQPGKKRG
ncbi:MAG: PilN domain-containing protein [Gammaproteobacteria bacterium]|uniref:PilN domain-containing protein n=1 Tax=Pseudomaricurvus alcaniphilus TaxID=1166482 RepID=UPI00140BC82E|nr:PilN domain-containing protein [Pseudomaricurvus alcaniphilus]MBR9909830.1 PilN domain-containing protein [Gammaproteobacteria bacterium]NHN38556.1 PilN domain-containing protein [Pseudomaricurvus alcaniphilus]